MKQCPVCIDHQPETEFKTRPSGKLAVVCNTCIKSKRGIRTASQPRILTEVQRGRDCPQCRRTLSPEGFDRNNARKDKRSLLCADCMHHNNTTMLRTHIIQEGPPLKRVEYHEAILDHKHGVNAGKRVLQRVEVDYLSQ